MLENKLTDISVPQYIGHFFDGKHVSDKARVLDIINPATGEAIRQVSLANKATVQQVITVAQQAFPSWRDTPVAKRVRIMFRFKQLLEIYTEQIVKLITEEHGKVIDDARGEFLRGVEVVEYACSAAEFLKGEHSKNVGPAIDSWSEFQAMGVVAGITPFNFPAMVPMWMYPMAIVCGNTFILKPSEQDPSASLFIAELFKMAGLPDGVFNIVNGDKEAVDELLKNPAVKAISFVGSTPIAEYVYQTGAAAGKRVQALGGAKNHAVVMPDADMDNVVNGLMGAAFGSGGERCMAISVAVCVGDEVANRLVSRLSEKVKQLRIGSGVEDNDMGPLISAAHLARVSAFVDQGVEQGADLVVDGRKLSVKGLEGGYFIGGCLFDAVTAEMSIYQQEIFGPVLSVMRVESLEQAMQLIDDHEYGNGTCIFTRDGGVARFFTDNIQVGMVGVNVPLPVPVAYHSFGGWKRSLFGDLSIYGPDAVRFYTRRKTITQRWPKDSLDKIQFSFPSHE